MPTAWPRVGKSFFALGLAQKACRDGYSTLYLPAALHFSKSTGISDVRFPSRLASRVSRGHQSLR